jgi:hypothetical protein
MNKGYGTANYKEHKSDVAESVSTLFLVDHDILADQYDTLQNQAQQYALDFAKVSLLKYSAEHPQRECILCVAMGGATLHVERWAYGRRDDYMFNAGSTDQTIPAPEFMERLARLGEALGHNYHDWYGPIRMVAHHGVLLKEDGIW